MHGGVSNKSNRAEEIKSGICGEAEEVGDLSADNENADGGGVGDDDRAGNELRDFAEVRESGGELENADEAGEEDGERGRGKADVAEAVNGRGEEDADGVGGTEDKVPRGAEKSADESADDNGHDDHFGGESGDEGKADGLGNGNERDGESGEKIGAEFSERVAAKLGEERKTRFDPIARAALDLFDGGVYVCVVGRVHCSLVFTTEARVFRSGFSIVCNIFPIRAALVFLNGKETKAQRTDWKFIIRGLTQIGF